MADVSECFLNKYTAHRGQHVYQVVGCDHGTYVIGHDPDGPKAPAAEAARGVRRAAEKFARWTAENVGHAEAQVRKFHGVRAALRAEE